MGAGVGSGQLLSGYCPGGNHIKCCPSGQTDEKATHTCSGQCIDIRTHVCASGDTPVNVNCAGSLNIQCCATGTGKPKPPPPSACSVFGDGSTIGQCWDKTKKTCSVSFKRGLCPGGSNIVCCPTGKEAVVAGTPAPPSNTCQQVFVGGQCEDTNTKCRRDASFVSGLCLPLKE